jgi:hypothetical protein
VVTTYRVSCVAGEAKGAWTRGAHGEDSCRLSARLCNRLRGCREAKQKEESFPSSHAHSITRSTVVISQQAVNPWPCAEPCSSPRDSSPSSNLFSGSDSVSLFLLSLLLGALFYGICQGFPIFFSC